MRFPGTELLLQKLDEIAAYNTNNHLPLMGGFMPIQHFLVWCVL